MDSENRRRVIKGFLARNGIRQTEIAKDAKVAPSAVSAYIRGVKKHARVKESLIKFGVPSCLLDETSETATVKDLSRILRISECGVRKKAQREGWFYRKTRKLRGGGFRYAFPVDMLPQDIQRALANEQTVD